MGKTPEATKQLLEKALQELPYQNDTHNARFHIKKALNEITKVTDKQTKKQNERTPVQQWQLDLETGGMINPNISPIVLKNLEALIEHEKLKLEDIKRKTQPHQVMSMNPATHQMQPKLFNG